MSAETPDLTPAWLPTFPVDDEMLDRLEHAIGTSWDYGDNGERVRHGGEYTLTELLDFISGYDPSLAIPLGRAAGPLGEDVDWSEYPFPVYTEHDVIKALVSEIRSLRANSPSDLTIGPRL